MRKAQYRTREYTSHNNKRSSKLSQQNIQSRCSPTDKYLLNKDVSRS